MPNGPWDVIVIGSGFGGAVSACRLAEKGRRVLVLERGRQWTIDKDWTGPDDWFFDANHPADHNGWFDFRVFGRMSTIAGAGVGGGSLHYANVSIDAPPDAFDRGWPAAITHSALAPYYATVKGMIEPQQVPDRQEPQKLVLLRDAARRLGYESQFRKVDIAVRFDPALTYDSSQPALDPATIALTANKFGVLQGTCAHLGECVTGCRARARNMLDTNYIAVARQRGAEVWPLHIVRKITPSAMGYVVDYDQIVPGGLLPGSASAKLIVVSAGSVGTSELLLFCRDAHKTLPKLGPMVGRQWCCNTNYLTTADHPGVSVQPTRGPSITGAVGFFGSQAHMGAGVNIEDGGIPPSVLPFASRAGLGLFGKSDLLAGLHQGLGSEQLFEHTMPWFAQGRDESTGVFKLQRAFLGLFGPKVLALDWNSSSADKPMDAIIDLHNRMATATGGNPPPSLWPLLRSLVTPHPLGGCVMADDPARGVVNDKGESFAYRNLYVADGSIVPRAIGLNPSKTIAALAERIVEHILAEGR